MLTRTHIHKHIHAHMHAHTYTHALVSEAWERHSGARGMLLLSLPHDSVIDLYSSEAVEP